MTTNNDLIEHLAGVLEGGSDGVGGDWGREEAAIAIRHEAAQYLKSRQQSTQPAPDGGEWQVECQLVKLANPPRGRVVIKDVKTLRIIVCEDSPSRWDQALVDFEQIVADHRAVPKLVEALRRRVSPTKCYCEVMLGARCGECADRELLATLTTTTTTQRDAGEGQK